MFKLPPLLLHYYITYRCNCRCCFCDIWKLPQHQHHFADVADVAKNLQSAHELGVRFVDFTGGEPLLHNDLPHFLLKAKQLGFRTSITTNCILYPKQANALKGNIDYLHFSLDALHASSHDNLRGLPTFDRVMESLDVARQMGETPDMLFTVTPQTARHIKPLALFAQRLRLMLIVNPVFAYGEMEKAEPAFLKTLDAYRATPYVYVNTAFHKLRRSGGNQISAPRCRVVDSTIVISPDNQQILPCYHFRHGAVDIGAIDAKNPLLALRQTGVWKEFRNHQGRCAECQGCHVNCYFDPSFFYQLDVYFWSSLLAKARYWWNKNLRKRIEQKKPDERPAVEIAHEIWETHGFSD